MWKDSNHQSWDELHPRTWVAMCHFDEDLPRVHGSCWWNSLSLNLDVQSNLVEKQWKLTALIGHCTHNPHHHHIHIDQVGVFGCRPDRLLVLGHPDAWFREESTLIVRASGGVRQWFILLQFVLIFREQPSKSVMMTSNPSVACSNNSAFFWFWGGISCCALSHVPIDLPATGSFPAILWLQASKPVVVSQIDLSPPIGWPGSCTPTFRLPARLVLLLLSQPLLWVSLSHFIILPYWQAAATEGIY